MAEKRRGPEVSAMLHAVEEAIVAVDAQLLITFLNRTAERWYGMTAEQALNQFIGELFQVEDFPNCYQAIPDLVRRNGIWNTEAYHVGAGGHRIAVDWTITLLDPSDSNAGFVCVAHDITIRKQTEAIWHKIADESLQGITISRPDRLVYINRAAAELLGSTPEQIRTMTLEQLKKLIHPDDQPKLVDAHRARLAGLALPTKFECRAVRPDGSTIWLEVMTSLIEHEGEPAVMSVAIDVTARHKAEEEVQRDRRQFLAGPVVAFKWKAEPGWPVDYVSPNVSQFGYQPADFVAGRIAYLDILDPADRDRVANEVERFIRAGLPSCSQQYRLQCADGTVRWVREHLVVVKDAAGVITHFDSYLIDVTAARETEERLRSAHEKLARLANSVPVLLAWVGADRRLLLVNQAYADFYGRPVEELIGRHAQEVIGEEAYQRAAPLMDAVLAGQHVSFENRVVDCHGQERVVLAEYTPDFDSEGRVQAFFASVRDITEQKQAEEALRRSEAKFAAAFQCVPSPMAISSTVDNRFLDVNEAFLRTLGYSHDEVIGRTAGELNLFVVPSQRDAVLEVLRREGHARDQEVTIRTKSGLLRHGLFSADLIQLAQQQVLLTVMNDITEQRKAEADRRRSEANFTTAFMANPLPMALSTPDEGRYVEVNDAFVSILSYSREDAVGKTSQELGVFVDYNQRLKIVEAIKQTGQVRDIEADVRSRQGEIRHGLFSGQLIHVQDRDLVLLVMNDVTERRRAEDALRDNEALLKSLLAAAPVGIGLVRNRKFEWLSEQFVQMVGYDREELIGQDARLLYESDEEYNRLGQLQLSKSVRDTGAGAVETRWRRKDGTLIDVHIRGNAVSEKDLSKGITFTALDITERRRTEAALRESEALLASVLRAAPIGIGLVRNRVFAWVSDQLTKMLGYSAEEMIGQSARMLYETEEEFLRVGREKYADIERTGTGTVETRWRRKDGTVMDILLSSNAIDPQNLAVGVTFTALDITDRKRAEQKLANTTAELDRYFSVALDLLCIADIDGHFRRLNPQWEKVLGYSTAELEGRVFLDFVHPDDVAETVAAISALSDQQEVHHFVNRYRHRNGGYRWIEWNSIPVGNLIYSAAHDITERKESEEALRQSEYRLRRITDNMTDMVSQLDIEGRYTYASPSHQRVLGYTPNALLGTTAFEYIHPADRTLARAYFERALQAGIGEPSQVRFRHADGHYVWLDVSGQVMLDENGRVEGATLSSRDVTQRKHAELLLEAQRDLALELSHATELDQALQRCLDMALTQSGCDAGGVYLVQPNGDLTLVASRGWTTRFEQASRFFAADHPQAKLIASKLPYYVMADQNIDGTKDAVQEGLLSAAVIPIVHTGQAIAALMVHSHSGGEMPTHTRKALEAIGTQTAHAIARLKAEREKGALEEQLRQSQKMEAIGRLAGGIAHDFNNIMTGILGYTQMLLGATMPDDPKQKDLLEIERAANRAADLTRQLLAFSRKQIIAPVVTSLNEIIEHSRRMLERLIGEDIVLLTEPAPGLWPARLDPGQMEQVLVNLAVNARDAMPKGGRLTVRTANTSLDTEHAQNIPDATPGDWVVLTVADTGSGMSDEIKQHLFEPFFTTKEKDRGTGLGLATVYGIVRQNGGFIEVHSRPNAGSVFRIYLPRVEEPVVTLARRAAVDLPRGKETVLVVEDETSVRRLVRKVLERHGYRVLEAAGPTEAFATFDKHGKEVDLLLTDVIMPTMDGRRLSQRLLAIRPQLKVLFMSGYTEDVIAHHGVLDSNTSFMQKPFSIETLVRRVRETLDN